MGKLCFLEYFMNRKFTFLQKNILLINYQKHVQFFLLLTFVSYVHCGRLSSLIIGGNDVQDQTDYPYVASLQYKSRRHIE